MQELIAEAQRMRDEKNKVAISLNEAVRRKQMEEDEKNRRTHPEVEGELENLETGNADSKALKIKDLYLQESLFVLADLIAIKES